MQIFGWEGGCVPLPSPVLTYFVDGDDFHDDGDHFHDDGDYFHDEGDDFHDVCHYFKNDGDALHHVGDHLMMILKMVMIFRMMKIVRT